uniref:Uncharacterized protein n=1 Tax=Arundo donax TaxID=35708 RepID=A0A0A9GJ19_ARUDO
MAGEGGAI